MSTRWLSDELREKSDAVQDGKSPILTIKLKTGDERIYCPDPGEYRVTADVVHKAQGLGATIIAYSSSWGDVTYEGREFGKKYGIRVMPYSELFKYLREQGIMFHL